ncbi:MAG: FHA domain-containing protein [bacterium]|nr:FHA domain-containing protein [bacterium]
MDQVAGVEITLVTAQDERTKRQYLLEEREITVGRGRENTITVCDARVSRQHLRITCLADAYTIENLSDRNPLLVNGEHVRGATLRDGDQIGIGDSSLFFRHAPAEKATEISQSTCITIDARDSDALLAGLDEEDVGDLQRAKADLTSLYRTGRELSVSLSSADLCSKTLESIVVHMDSVDCCSLHLLDAESGALECRAIRFRSGKPEGLPDAFSHTILNQVQAERKAVLSFDAQGDDRFVAAPSVASLSIRSAMCVPIQVQTRLTGVLQAHTQRTNRRSTVNDLKLLTAFGMMAGPAIENALLYEGIDAERRVQQDKAKMMQVMLHELKSPIAGARMLADTLRMQTLPPEKRAHVQDRIVTRLDDMLEWIKDSLDLSKLKSGELLGESRRLDIAQLTEEIVAEYREQAEAKGLTCSVETPPGPLFASMPEAGFRLVLSNLVSNAVKYTPEGNVCVRVSESEGEAVVAVSDSGIGIPAADVPKMFAEFFRASNARASSIEGSGVGLASVKCIVEGVGGTLGLDSEEGRGSTFTVRLPMED